MKKQKNISAIILGAGHDPAFTDSKSIPISLTEDQHGETALKWDINALKKNKVDKIRFVGGYEIQKVGSRFPNLDFVYNPVWQETGVLGSLYQARKYINGPVIICYGDIVYTSDVVKNILKGNPNGITVAYEEKNMISANNNSNIIKNVVFVNKEELNKIGFFKQSDKASGEFIGMVCFNGNSWKDLREFLDKIYPTLLNKKFEQSNKIQNAYLTDLLSYFLNNNKSISCVNIGNEWIELQNEDSLTKFIMGTKGDTLKKLKSMLKKSKLCNQYIFRVSEWEKNSELIIKKIKNTFSSDKLAFRSSSELEDSFKSSNAGAFESLLNISSSNKIEIKNAITEVIKSYKNTELDHQVLVQNMVEGVVMSGVVFTVDMETSAPYYVISFDKSSSRTDTVTSGTSDKIQTVLISKSIDKRKIPLEFKTLINSVIEIEEIANYEALDIEFAINDQNEIYILQVRPIVSYNKYEKNNFNTQALKKLSNFLKTKFSPSSSLFGKTTIFADMPDWNPAEMIGTNPKPLAYSLYDYLITKKTWRDARAEIGYFNPKSTDLMYNICGYPYIDVRASFNNLSPADLPSVLFEKLINHYLDRLTRHPEKNDKVEFEILFTCLDFSFNQKIKHFKNNGFKESEFEILKDRLLALTDNIISGKVHPLESLKESFNTLDLNQEKIISSYKKSNDVFLTIKLLLDNCISFGTMPFSILARYAFIANSLIRSLVDEQLLSLERSNQFFNSITTIATKLIGDLDNFYKGELNKDDFLKIYGHLRPGTYDINSKKYSENFDNYFNVKYHKKSNQKNKDIEFALNNDEICNINNVIRKNNFSFNVHELFSFSKSAISLREYGKFKFTKSISIVFDLLISLGEDLDISREDLAYLNIDEFLSLRNNFTLFSDKIEIKKIIEKNKENYKQNKLIHLPNIIINDDDINVIRFSKSRPNYVTQGNISAEPIFLEKINKFVDLNDKIVLIESADPGFDWIFTHKIKGLITKYGGSASHMTIRANEFNIPAAIGCGDQIFNKAKNSNIIELNCSEKYINVY